MITRGTLELAAKAAGLKLYERDVLGLCVKLKAGQLAYDVVQWQPHIDHGQLLDLAMACGIVIDPQKNEIRYLVTSIGRLEEFCKEADCQDFSALAEAIITAAAEQQQAKEKTE